MSVALLWDDPPRVWDLLAQRAMNVFGVPYCLVKTQDIAHAALADKFSLLVLPGGSAGRRLSRLGQSGHDAITAFVQKGGNCLGLGGGAEMALAGGLGLCAWECAQAPDPWRLLSGNVRVRCMPGSGGESAPLRFEGGAALPEADMFVWHPCRLMPPDQPKQGDGIVLAEAAGPGADLEFAGMAMEKLEGGALAVFEQDASLRLNVSGFPEGPCVLGGTFGRGRWVLSLPHLEAPAHEAANAWLARLLESLGGTVPQGVRLPAWHPGVGVRWLEKRLLGCREQLLEMYARCLTHGLLVPRSGWLFEWRGGVSEEALNALWAAFSVLASECPRPEAEDAWDSVAEEICGLCRGALEGTEALLLGQRAEGQCAGLLRKGALESRRLALFGADDEGGMYGRLLSLLGRVLFVQLQGGA